MKVIGLTGGIASGKSTVSRILLNLGAVIIDADIIARIIVEPGEESLNLIVTHFGYKILNEDGTLNRKALGSIVFNDAESLKLLNRITHPEIKKRAIAMLEEIERHDANSVAVIDAAVLIESGMNMIVDEIWLVYVDYSTQIKRLIERDKLSFNMADARIKSQMPLEEKIKFCDKIIDNTKDIEYTRQQVVRLWNEIKG